MNKKIVIKIKRPGDDLKSGLSFKETNTITVPASHRGKRSSDMRGFLMFVGIMLVVVGLGLIACPIVKHYQFNIGCEGYLKSAADAPTVELAKAELDVAIKYLTFHNKDEGFSHLIIKNRQADVGYWYTRLVVARNDLNDVEDEKETLRVLRESLTDAGDGGTVVTIPPNIAIFPHQWFWTYMMVLGLISSIFGAIGIMASKEI